ncbi:MAG: hypothetical protein GEU86_19750 [Actinophytocola sp.]|nr:hypothetical protein [Actinophytocola sp.]
MSLRKTTLVSVFAAAVLAVSACSPGGDEQSPPAGNNEAQTSEPAQEDEQASGKAAVDAPASELRAGLTHLLTEHVYRAGIAVKTAVDKGGEMDDPTVKAAVASLDKNSVDLSKAVGAAYPDAEKPFLEAWRQHIGFFVDYTLGKATKDKAMAAKAQKDLDGYRTSFGELINSVNKELPADAVAEELKPHVASLSAAIDSVVANDGKAFDLLKKAAGHMPMTAATLAGGISEDKKLG